MLKLKHAGLCRLVTVLAVPVLCLTPGLVAMCVQTVPDAVKSGLLLMGMLGTLAVMFLLLPRLLVVDHLLAKLSCVQRARTQYPVSPRKEKAILRRLSHYGKACQGLKDQIQPVHLRYRMDSMASYVKGLERVVAAYEVPQLDRETYHSILSSGNRNATKLWGTGKLHLQAIHYGRGRHWKRNRVTVILILAQQVEPEFAQELPKLLAKPSGSGEQWVLPCVVDLGRGLCLFDSLSQPYFGFEYHPKNRGINMIRKLVFGGRLPRSGPRYPIPGDLEVDQNQSLWSFWWDPFQEEKPLSREEKKLLKSLSPGEYQFQPGQGPWGELYARHQSKGLVLRTHWSQDRKTIQVEKPRQWQFPRMAPMTKAARETLTAQIKAHWTAQGIQVHFLPAQELKHLEQQETRGKPC